MRAQRWRSSRVRACSVTRTYGYGRLYLLDNTAGSKSDIELPPSIMPTADDMRLQHTSYRRRAQAAFITFIALVSQFSAHLSMTAREKGDRAIWTEEETGALLTYLIEHKAEAGDGANFKASTFSNAAKLLVPMKVKGGEKTADVCKRKWASVCTTMTIR